MVESRIASFHAEAKGTNQRIGLTRNRNLTGVCYIFHKCRQVGRENRPIPPCTINCKCVWNRFGPFCIIQIDPFSIVIPFMRKMREDVRPCKHNRTCHIRLAVEIQYAPPAESFWPMVSRGGRTRTQRKEKQRNEYSTFHGPITPQRTGSYTVAIDHIEIQKNVHKCLAER